MSTERERWLAAVQLQHDTVAKVDALPVGDDAASKEFARLINAATVELMDAMHALIDIGDPLDNAERRGAYQLHRDAIFRRLQRTIAWNAERAVDEQLRDRAAAAQLVMEAVAPADRPIGRSPIDAPWMPISDEEEGA